MPFDTGGPATFNRGPHAPNPHMPSFRRQGEPREVQPSLSTDLWTELERVGRRCCGFCLPGAMQQRSPGAAALTDWTTSSTIAPVVSPLHPPDIQKPAASRPRLASWNPKSYADRRGHGCPSAPAMQHSGAGHGTASSTVSQDPLRSKHKSGSVGVVDQTAGAGAKRSSRRRDRFRRDPAVPTVGLEAVIGSGGEPCSHPATGISGVMPTALLRAASMHLTQTRAGSEPAVQPALRCRDRPRRARAVRRGALARGRGRRDRASTRRRHRPALPCA
jgi:hypothetical protein